MMSKIIILVFSLFGLFSACVGQYVQLGQCPNVELVANFTAENFLGTWYELSRSNSPHQNGECAELHLTRTNNTINVRHSSVIENFLDDGSGTATLEDGTASVTLNISTYGSPIDLLVLLTDYQTFALTYSCENISASQRSVHIWILGRQRSFPNEMIPALINTTISTTFGINAQTLRPVQHGENECLVLPVIPAGQPIILPGRCDPNITVVQNFDVARFTGTWHQISSYRNSNSDGTCTRAQYTLVNGVVNVLNSQVNNRNLVTINGQATVSSNDGSARLSVVLNIGGVPTTQNLWVLATDYDNYGISYSCENLNDNQKRVYSWIISRTRQLPASARPQVDQVVNSIIDLNYRYYVDTDQSDNGCFFYPEPVPNTPVVFRGQCSSTNVQAMANFDAVRYMGLWHTIELYPASSQNGACSNAFYEFDAVAGRVDVRNSHVVNETLATVNAVAVPASTDGSARLIVTFPIPGSNLTVTSDYWVLTTDYINYALVYSCTNLNADEMRVTTWKLSRTKQLAPASQTAIAAAMNTALVLDQRYFQVMDQSVQGCFYYPVPQPGVPVVFPGLCDTTIPVVQNFNFAQFQGTWYEVQSYPNADQPGQCVNHAYSFVSNSQLNIVSTSVNDQFLETVTGTITSSTTDNSGRLIITITNPNGSVRTIPFWILATDYNNYALAYSCSNIRDDFQGVWSLKLSRTRQLTPASNTAINTAISTINVPVLGNQYYEDIDHSDWACYTLPNIPAGQPIIVPGQCSTNITGVQNFNLTAFVGRWRLIESYASNFQTGTCNVAEYNLVNANTIGFTNSQVVNQALASTSGTATVTSTDGSGRLTFTLPSGSTFEFYVLDTDYNSYALAYGCVNVNNNERRVYSWKLSRQNTLSQAAVNNINAVINTVDVLNNRFYYVVDRTETGCFYFPTPDSNNPVRFRGRCNQNIPVVTNFNATRYLGLWHDIQSYPVNFQDGTCNNALYSPGNDVDVYNTQVINETLFSILGSASLQNSTDGSAKLDVTFNVGGVNVTTNYWVLATDYDTYSFVYNCETIDDEYIRVAAWKLSRTKALPNAAATAINTVMSTIPVLDQRYFVTRDQSPNGCFYYPEPQPGVPVVFPGQCDDSIAAVPNFNMSSFSGVWYEIQAYPKNFHPGHCINHEFTLNGTNVLESLSTAVRRQRLNQIGGRVTFSSTNGSGRLVLSIITASGAVTNIPLWILSTDYTNYALAYSCSNINSDFREVFSWKLSRTRQLTPTANTFINNAISNVTVLDNFYYEDTEHTDSACFYLPDLAPGELVTLPGQCDTNITGMPNFNLTRYAGRWRLVESYGSRFQTGTCNVARYSVENSNTISVTNAQVVNQELISISGSANITSTDGSGLLLFTLEGRIPVFEYYVLDTDYDSYALGYGCVNVDSETRQVLSWKMSRFDTLTPAANANINRIIDSIDVLHQPYYYSVNRSEDSCFYFPTPNANTSVRFRGQCNQNMPVVNNFDVGRYLGLWHDIQSYPMPFQSGSCPNAFYAANNDSTVSVYNTHVVGESLSVINGVAVVASTDGSARLNVTFNILGNDVTTNYWVLATDYVNYAFVYSCTNIDDEYRSVTSWKLSRTKTLTPASNTAINTVMNNYNILDQRYYINRDQSPQGCFYYPEPEPGVPVVFPGQCDMTIAAVPGFSMNAFQGVWYEIAAYPTEELPGQCVSHEYSLSSTNSLLLDSLSVFNQTLSAIQGQVSFSSTDGSGRLIVNLNVSGQITPVPYWILSTDYNNYALAYSCVNLNSDYREVWSWKLSRTRQLTNASNTAINTAISNIDVLDNTYYEDIQQTDDACFYLPELGPTEPVIFPGQCDPNIPVLQNFNASRYLGRWRLIESYYTAFQEGSCNTAEYSAASDGSVTVFNTRVVNEQLSTITGRAVPASNDGSGRLVVTFPSSPEPMDYWILDTDYDSYALVYTCQNLNRNEKRVWSWKLSRTNTLTPSATAAINQIVNRIDVLNDRYYQSIDRTDAGCFYYPTPDSSSTVVFPGQCNENIPAVPNFNAALYAGRWYDVESYPTNFQQGTCNTAQYTLTPSGVVDVQNTQIVNQILQTTTGTAAVVSTDGSARLNVTFNLSSGSVTTNYWVLATDYTTYSLVYSCRNIDAETRAVYSWKLGRQTSIPPAANTAINNVLNTVQVLSQQYYVQRDHSEQGCFFYPDNNGGDVILNSQCLPDAQVPAITNFNANLWPGTWHEVARFPSTIQNGECGNTQYTVSGNNTFSVLRTFVINETLASSSTQATVPATGRGVFTANINGVPFNNVYILATDYTEYALAYACRNLNANTKQVYSWKLSRSRAGLSAAANNVINQIVSSNIDLHEPYYWYTGQDNAACFHYPVFDQLPDVIQLPGPCDTSIRAVSNFNAAAYLGRWFELARYPQAAQSGQCNRAEYSPLGNAVSIVNSQVVNSTLATINGTAVTVGSDGILQVTFVVGGGIRNVDYYVLATDYDNYALVYTCINQPNGNRQVGSWKLSRSTTLSSQALAVMDAVISNTQGLREEYYQTTSQSDESCFYVPEVNPQEAPLFRGQCENITGMPGFNPTSYLGWWHEIERYPVDGGVRDCVSSQYEAVGNSIQVVDTSINGLAAVTARGTATVTNDGRIRRVFGNNRVEDLWVIATDYESYALLYSCENINSEYRRVWSAKHSKARSLTQNAQQAMAPAITSNRVLYPQFYQTIDQSDSACFHYPIQTEAQVVLPGQCDINIPVVQNFNVEEFQGSWYQIQRYDAVGDSSCASTGLVYNETSGNINVIAYEVVDGELSAVEGSARLTSTDGSARLSLVLPVAGTNDTSTTIIYILATDYTDYALAYSCVNVGPFRRRVGAWQLSRDRTLSASGAAAINSVVNQRQELHVPYFKQISQTECPEPSSAFFIQSSIIVMAICAMLQLVL